MAAVGNFLVCYTILSNTNLRGNPTNLFLISLAVSGLLTATLAMPFDIVSFPSRQLATWKDNVRNISHSLPHYCTHLHFDSFGHQCGSLHKHQRSYETISQYRVRDTSKSRNCDQHHLGLQHHMGSSSQHGLAGKRSRADIQRRLHGHLYKLYNILSSFLNFVGPLLLTCVFFILAFITLHHASNRRPVHRFNAAGPSRQPCKEPKSGQDHFNVCGSIFLLLAALNVFQYRFQSLWWRTLEAIPVESLRGRDS